MNRLLKFFEQMANLCFLCSKYLCYFLVIAITGIMFVEVIMRYFLNSPLMWAESIVRFFLVGLSFLAAGMAFRLRRHMFISLLWNKFNPTMQKGLRTLFDLLIFLFFVFFTIVGYETAISIKGFLWELGYLDKKWLFMMIPVSGVIISFQVLYLVLEDLFVLKEDN